MKDFDAWNSFKKNIEKRETKNLYIKERQIWWSSVGLNIGHEIDGKNTLYERPVLILKKVNRNNVFIVPLSSKNTDTHYYVSADFNNQKQYAVLNQCKTLDVRRMTRKIGAMDADIFENILKSFIQKYGSRLAAASSDPEGLDINSLSSGAKLSSKTRGATRVSLGVSLIGVRDLEKAKEWYQNVFGMELVEYKPPSFMEMKLGDSIFNIETYSEERREGFKEVSVGGLKSCVFRVDDMDKFTENCQKYKVAILVEPVLQSFGWWTAKIQDQDGNIFIIESKDTIKQ